ncbi:glycosyltransferase family 4 protein [Adhaeribacter swui]|uniref:Glycosyltransferase family 4 protein n=1 Tax=Adhaeribacter swui TaxID=2086471 RepID=A0A7G7G5G6_9BACT|nr:glycosyltransferase family 4 protein [Adhaeribacter swui]QNF32400.1 glycosyltransferase family 4 protein [Adhaeribacter swui]
MKIVYFYQYFGTPKGGWSTRVYEMTKRWVAAGHEVTVVTSPYDKSDLPVGKGLISKYDFEGIQVIAINLLQSNKHHVLKRLFTFCAFSLISIFYSLKLKCDVVIASSGPITIGLPGLTARYLRGKKLVFEVRDLWPEGAIQLGFMKSNWMKSIAYGFEKMCYRASSLIVACSDGMRDSIKTRYPETNVLVIPNASDVELFQQPINLTLPEWTQGKCVFVYTGSLGLMDDCQQIIMAALELKKRGNNQVKIVMIGEGAEKKQLQDLCVKYALDNVHFLGLIPKTQVIGWLQKAYAAFVVFKNLEVLQTSSPNKMFDAFAAGVPIVQSTQGWIKQTLQRHNAGITVLPDEPATFADAIEYLVNNPAARNQMAANSLSLAQNYFNRNKLASDFLNAMVLLHTKQR